MFYLVLTWALIALTFIDLDTMLLPDEITLPILWLGMILSVVGLTIPPEDAIIGAVSAISACGRYYWLFKLATGKEGMGYGDFKLLALFGAWLGWQVFSC